MMCVCIQLDDCIDVYVCAVCVMDDVYVHMMCVCISVCAVCMRSIAIAMTMRSCHCESLPLLTTMHNPMLSMANYIVITLCVLWRCISSIVSSGKDGALS